jgi:hypothetical protein
MKAEQENLKNYETISSVPFREFAELISSNQAMSVSQARSELNEISPNQQDDYEFVMPSTYKQNRETISYSSVKDSIVKATKDFNQNICRTSKLEP